MSAFEEIYQLYMRYADGIDKRDYPKARAVFADGSTVIGVASQGPVDEFFATVEQSMLNWGKSMHLVGNVLTDIDEAAGTAHADCTTVVYFLEPVGEGDETVRAVSYSDTLRKSPEGWRIVERRIAKIWEKQGL